MHGTPNYGATGITQNPTIVKEPPGDTASVVSHQRDAVINVDALLNQAGQTSADPADHLKKTPTSQLSVVHASEESSHYAPFQAYPHSHGSGQHLSAASTANSTTALLIPHQVPTNYSSATVVAGITTPSLILDDRQSSIAEHFFTKYFAEFDKTSAPGQRSPALWQAAQVAALAFDKVGQRTAIDADKQFSALLAHDRKVRTIGAGVAGGTAYSLAIALFVTKIAPFLGNRASPAMQGFFLGLPVGTLEGLCTPAINAVIKRHLHGGGNSVPIPEIDDQRPDLKKTIATAAAMNAFYTGLKNSSRIVAAALLPQPIQRQMFFYLDLALDVGGCFLSGGASSFHTYQTLAKDFEAVSFLTQKDLEARLENASRETSLASFASTLVDDARTAFSAAAKSVAAPSSVLVTLYASALVAALLHCNSLITKSHENDGLAPDEMSNLEAVSRSSVSTAAVSMLVGGATALGISAGRFIDPYFDAAIDVASSWLAGMGRSEIGAQQPA